MHYSHRIEPLHRSDRPPARSFTLLEVLVVVAIIALLAAILIPGLANARLQARRVACQTQLKQITAAFELFFHDSRDRLLRGVNKEYNYGGRQGNGSNSFGKNPNAPVPKPLNKYLKLSQVTRIGAEVFSCPADTGTRFIRPSAFGYYGTSYYPNHLLIGQNQVSPPFGDPCQSTASLWTKVNSKIKTLTRSGVKDTSKVILIGDYPGSTTGIRPCPMTFPSGTRKGLRTISHSWTVTWNSPRFAKASTRTHTTRCCHFRTFASRRPAARPRSSFTDRHRPPVLRKMRLPCPFPKQAAVISR
jgi:prepilin-type N-terminal cleavage/methylation domain-containing protein